MERGDFSFACRAFLQRGVEERHSTTPTIYLMAIILINHAYLFSFF